MDVRKILVPIDFSTASTHAFCLALRFATELGSAITLIHVLEPETPLTLAGRPATTAFPDEELAGMEKNLRDLIETADAAGLPGPHSIIRTGLASHEILKAARDLDVDLIIIGAHGLTSWKHFAIGSTADCVTRGAPCPVLVVRAKEHDFV